MAKRKRPVARKKKDPVKERRKSYEKAVRKSDSESRRRTWEDRIGYGQAAYAVHVGRHAANRLVILPLSKYAQAGDLKLSSKKK